MRGHYQVPIAVMDFASLYPCIMLAYNVCYSTLVVDKNIVNKLGEENFTKSPLDIYFVKREIKHGLLPQILYDLLSARKIVKEKYKKETNTLKRALLDGRQEALKVAANSVYGFTGAIIGILRNLEISGSITAWGRLMIDQTRSLITNIYSKNNGYKYNAKVIYGDTDSVMIKFGVKTVEEAMKLGREASKKITKHFPRPI